MKEPTRAPAYAEIYHGLCGIARRQGYALAIHGTLSSDLDLIAVPWTADATEPESLVDALRDHIDALLEPLPARDPNNPERKPHGRIAWNLYMGAGAQVDLSVLPLRPNASLSRPGDAVSPGSARSDSCTRPDHEG